jgi:hypothetical protein
MKITKRHISKLHIDAIVEELGDTVDKREILRASRGTVQYYRSHFTENRFPDMTADLTRVITSYVVRVMEEEGYKRLDNQGPWVKS